MKKLYEFTVYKTEKVQEKEVTTGPEGQEITSTKTVEKKIPKTFFIKKPNRVMFDDADLFYGVNLSALIKQGLLTRAQLATKFQDEASTISEQEKVAYTENVLKLIDLENQYKLVVTSTTGDLSEDDKVKTKGILDEIVRVRTALADFENQQNNLFEHTAENRARNKTILWWTLHLAYNSDEKPVFGEGDFTARLANYDKFEEDEDEFMLDVTKRFLLVISFWYTGRAENKEDFDTLISSTFKDAS